MQRNVLSALEGLQSRSLKVLPLSFLYLSAQQQRRICGTHLSIRQTRTGLVTSGVVPADRIFLGELELCNKRSMAEIYNLCSLMSIHLAEHSALDFRLAYSSLTLDIISHYPFGESWGTLSKKEQI